MTVNDIINTRSITEVLHFTTNHGLGGILATRTVKSRNLLSVNQYIEHIYKENCEDRSRDSAWHDYVNLSITRINARLFGIASGNWHSGLDGWWCVLSFKPEVLSQDGVVFTTTNNIYTGVNRGSGAEGLDALFASSITHWQYKIVTRPPEWPDCQPTCIQSEVLYPKELSTDFLQHIYVRKEEHLDEVEGMFGFLSMPSIPTSIDLCVFAT